MRNPEAIALVVSVALVWAALVAIAFFFSEQLPIGVQTSMGLGNTVEPAVEVERAVLRHASVFAGGFDVDAGIAEIQFSAFAEMGALWTGCRLNPGSQFGGGGWPNGPAL